MYDPPGYDCYGCKALARRVEDAEERLIELKEHCAALESREVCAVAHDDVDTCGYCQRDALSKDAARYRWLRANNSFDAKFCISIEDDDDPSVAYSGHSPIELDGIIDAAMERR